MVEQAKTLMRDIWPAGVILVLYVALMGVPGHVEVGDLRHEKQRLETPEGARSLLVVQQRYQNLQQRMSRVDERVRVAAEADASGKNAVSNEQLRIIGRLLAEHHLVLVEEGPAAAGEAWSVRFHGSYGDVSAFMDSLARIEPPVLTDSLDMDVSNGEGPIWTLRFAP